jgi:hypothetical protein
VPAMRPCERRREAARILAPRGIRQHYRFRMP